MASEVFVDTGGFFSLLCPHDPCHAQAADYIKHMTGQQSLVTTDYILDETVTLLKARKQAHLIESWLDNVFETCQIEWMTPRRFAEVQRFFIKHSDKQWSFTDCFSFCAMKQRKIQRALANDHHYQQAGFEPLLVDH